MQYLELYLKFFGSIFIMCLTWRNCGCRCRNRTVKRVFGFLFNSFRIAIFVGIIYFLGPDFKALCKRTIDIYNENWWKNKDDPFITNGDSVNAAVCWVCWGIVAFIIFFSIFFVCPLPKCLTHTNTHCLPHL